jgi:hypothetical protein
MRAFAEPARQFVGELAVQTSSASVPGVAGRVERATLKLKPARLELGGQPVSLEPQAFELLYHFDGSLVHAAAGRSAGAALAELVKPAGPTLEQDPVLGAAAKRAGAVSFAAVVRPLAFVEPAAKLDRSAPVLVVLGPKSPGAGLLRLIAARPVVEAVAGGAFDL